ncbi:MAG: hypothetical protein WAM72_12870, partial [Xanthobacteraceae bacterium]
GESNLNPALYYQNNVGGTAALLETMPECGISKIVHSRRFCPISQIAPASSERAILARFSRSHPD